MPLNRSLAAVALLPVALASMGCSPRTVEGSLTALMDLTYDQAYVESANDEVSVRFAQKRGEGEDTVLRVTVRRAGIELFPDIEFDMAEILPGGGSRGIVSRNVLDDPRR